MLTKLEYESGLIKEKSTSELLRFTICHILNQVHNQRNIWFFKNCRAQYNQQQELHSQVILPSTTTTASQQQGSNLSHEKNMPPGKIILLPAQTNSTNYTDNVSNDLLNFKDSIRFTKHYVK
jgi:protein involved in sex pheromone biosynthesis